MKCQPSRGGACSGSGGDENGNTDGGKCTGDGGGEARWQHHMAARRIGMGAAARKRAGDAKKKGPAFSAKPAKGIQCVPQTRKRARVHTHTHAHTHA